MKELTDKQTKVLQFINKFHADNAMMPTVREIAANFKLSIGSVQQHLKALQSKGFLIKRGSLSRGIDFPNRQNFSAVAILGSVHAGTFLEQVEDANDYVYINTDITRNRKCFALKVKGDSMEPSGIVEGDTIVVSQGEKVYNGDIVVALVDGESAVKIFYKEHDKIFLKSSNPHYPTITSDNIEIVGKLIYLVREYKG
ncbi:MAG: transcriptional repressor LexA [Endomicrobiia bacterium]|nr:transcriptional repressor LexA [Endomicrobiaceae bacterium]MDD3053419.1 transcriptional repressor LexA [Endomicrobiaceae bacterium]MDD3922576.1 transcriptional repressor LexA [Endomicrobiaceae bacterium]MDD5101572.1 transcriptional repressor LexA [Endomicrobiaceae bacterium]